MTERELFIAALRLPDDHARVAFLDGACADEPLRERVESMLREHKQLGSFLQGDSPGPAATVNLPPPPTTGPSPASFERRQVKLHATKS